MIFGLFKPRRSIKPTGDYPLGIVGESDYQRVLDSIAGGHTEDGLELETLGELILDENNPYDDQAVQVRIERRTIGYLSRKDSRKYRRWLEGQGASKRTIVECPALIAGGCDRGDGDVGHYSVRLDLRL